MGIGKFLYAGAKVALTVYERYQKHAAGKTADEEKQAKATALARRHSEHQVALDREAFPAKGALWRTVDAKGVVLLDSNVWMDSACAYAIKNFLTEMQRRGAMLEMPGEQFAEIENQKGADGEKGFRAREAIRLIVPWTEARVVKIGTTRNRAAEADIDTFFVRQIERLLADPEGPRIVLVTGDAGLQARVHSLPSEAAAGRLSVITLEVFKHAFRLPSPGSK